MSYNFPLSPSAGTLYAPAGGPSWRFLDGAWQQETEIDPPLIGAAYYDSVAQAAASTISGSLNAIQVLGYYAAGDGGGALYKRVVSEPAHAGKIHSADGAWWELAETVLRPEMFGAKGDAIVEGTSGTDDTIAMQGMADTAAAIKAECVGVPGKLYDVDNVAWPSGTILSHIRLQLRAGSTNDRSPVSVDGNSVAKSVYRFTDVHISGNRKNQTSLSLSRGGGRQGFKFRGRVSDVRMAGCTASYCASDGLLISIGDIVPATDDDYGIQNFWIEDCVFDWNRRHGWTAANFKNLHMVRSLFRNNGRNHPAATSEPDDHGMIGEKTGGNLYGRGFDIEENATGSGFDGLYITDCEATTNVNGVLFHAGRPWDGTFVTRKNVWIAGGTYDVGVFAAPVGTIAISFGPAVAHSSFLYENVNISGVELPVGGVRLNNTLSWSVGSHTSGAFNAAANCLSLVKCGMGTENAWADESPSTRVSIGTLPYTLTASQGLGTAMTIGSPVTTFIRTLPGGGHVHEYSATWTPALAETVRYTWSPSGNFKMSRAEGSILGTDNVVVPIALQRTAAANRPLQLTATFPTVQAYTVQVQFDVVSR